MFDIILFIDKRTSLNNVSYGALLVGNLFLLKKTLELFESMNILVGSYFLRPMSILSISLEAFTTCVLLI